MVGRILGNARKNKNDEFYTRLEDIEAEISSHPDYVRQFKDKVVLCNCDDPEWSNFYKFFRLHFKQLGLKKLITTHFNKDGSPSYKLEWDGEMLDDDTINMIKTPLKCDGDFRSEECVALLNEADIVVTNPPFSLFREYISLLMKMDKKFIVIGNVNAASYKEIFPLIQNDKLWTGYGFNITMIFEVGEDYKYDEKITAQMNDGKKYGKVPMVAWFTNLDIDKKHEPMPLTKNYKGNESKYPTYANFDAIEVGKTSDIPKDYKGIMGVPITFLSQYSSDQFEILGLGAGDLGVKAGVRPYDRTLKSLSSALRDGIPYLYDGKTVKVPYARIFIRRKQKGNN